MTELVNPCNLDGYGQNGPLAAFRLRSDGIAASHRHLMDLK